MFDTPPDTDWRQLVIYASIYVVAALVAFALFEKLCPRSWITRLVRLLCAPALSLVILILSPLAILFFWLYPEKHRTSIDRNGTAAEKQALADYRRSMSESLSGKRR